MKKISVKNSNFLFIEISDNPEYKYRIWDDFSGEIKNRSQYLVVDKNKENEYLKIGKPNLYKIINTTNNISEKQVIENFTGQSYLYSTDITGAWSGQVFSCDEDEETIALTPKESMKNLMKINKLSVNKNWIILKKII